jgi:hypothetical protein
MTKPLYAPGCFGSALAFKKADLICSNCPFALACEPVHVTNITILRSKYGLNPICLSPVLEIEPVPVAEPLAINLPEKVKALLRTLDNGNYNVCGSLLDGINPFGAALPFMAVACHVLLHMRRLEKSSTRDMMTTAMMTKFSWQKSTAGEHARIAIYALLHVGAIESNDGLLKIREKA